MARTTPLSTEKQEQNGFAASVWLPRPATTHQALELSTDRKNPPKNESPIISDRASSASVSVHP
jgi:hypothetical protein